MARGAREPSKAASQPDLNFGRFGGPAAPEKPCSGASGARGSPKLFSVYSVFQNKQNNRTDLQIKFFLKKEKKRLKARGHTSYIIQLIICNAIPCNAIPCNAIPCNAIPCNAIPCNSIPCNAIPMYLAPHHGARRGASHTFFFFVVVIWNRFHPLRRESSNHTVSASLMNKYTKRIDL